MFFHDALSLRLYRVKILAFDTSSITCSVALLDTDNQEGEKVLSLNKSLPMQKGKFILPLIQELLEQNNLSLKKLDAVAYGCGPGSFTGIRIANSVAQGMGFAVKLPIIKVSSMAAIAQAAFMEKGVNKCLVALDARMNQIYWAAYQVSTDECVDLIGREQVCEINLIETKNDLNMTEWCGVADGWEKYGIELCEKLGGSPNLIYATQLPTAEAVLALAKRKFERKEWVTAANAVPEYLN